MARRSSAVRRGSLQERVMDNVFDSPGQLPDRDAVAIAFLEESFPAGEILCVH